MPPDLILPKDLSYVLLLFVLFVLPRYLQRFRIPGAITSLLLGVLAGAFHLFEYDATISLLSTFGIVALFLFAGLDIDFEELRPDAKVLAQHLIVWGGALAAIAFIVTPVFHLTLRAGFLVSLALLTPSTGFILDSLAVLGLSDVERRWARSKAIGSEFLALGVLFVALQSTSLEQLALSTVALAALILVIPQLLQFFAKRIAPYAPRSEFAFLLMIAVLCAYATRRLGVYYLVGAFIVGVAARRFRKRLPAMSSDRMLEAVESFASVFTAFYFFHAGLEIDVQDFEWEAGIIGLAFLAIFVSLRLGLVMGHRRIALREGAREGFRVGLTLLPTLVFSLVVVDILQSGLTAPPNLLAGLVLYTIVNTMLPGLLLGKRAPDVFSARLAALEVGRQDPASFTKHPPEPEPSPAKAAGQPPAARPAGD